jgi:serine/threonine protein kinase/tetratricopeptide (TPR) repeat protein
MPFAVGENVGPYRIIDQLGQGGMATVYKAYHPALDRFVAIKAMHLAFMEDTSFLARFQREAQVVARLDHPNIVPVYDFSEHQGRPYLVMRFIDGETLKSRLQQGALEDFELERVVKAVSGSLAYAHSQGVLHRDIKPSNVLLASGGKVYLADFGLARIAQAGQSTLSSDVMLGTPQYISPEQARGVMDLDAGTDIYSFGVMLYEMVVGQVPFNADTPYSIIHDHIYSPLPVPHSLNPDIGSAVERVLLKALAKERQGRFKDVGVLGESFLQAWDTDREDSTSIPSVGRDPRAPLAGILGQAADPNGSTHPVEPIKAMEPIAQDWGGEISTRDTGSPTPHPVEEGGGLATESRSTQTYRRWWLLVPALLVICICGFITLSALGNLAERRRSGVRGPEVSSMVTQSQGPAEEGIASGDFGPIADSGAAEENPILSAQRRVSEAPRDAIPYLDLAQAFYDAGNLESALSTLDDGAAAAGDNNLNYYLEAAGWMTEHEYWLMAAEMYLRMAELNPRGLSAEVRDQVERSSYLATAEPGARLLLNLINDQSGFDGLLKDTLLARFKLYQGYPDIAEGVLNQVLGGDPGFGPGRLLQAEIFAHRGEVEDATGILDQLARSDDQRSWVASIASELLTELNKT